MQCKNKYLANKMKLPHDHIYSFYCEITTTFTNTNCILQLITICN